MSDSIINRSMTPSELLENQAYALVRTKENGDFWWLEDVYRLDGSAVSSMEEINKHVEDGSGRYEVVYIDHSEISGTADETDDAEMAEVCASLEATRLHLETVRDELQDIRAGYEALEDSHGRLEFAIDATLSVIATECELIRSEYADADVEHEDLIRVIDHKRFETLARMANLIEALTDGHHAAFIPSFPS